jgi:transcriptional pleiotropic regulator of transition state genes
MVNTGITRRLDDLGRIVIPKEWRTQLNFGNRGRLEISLENNFIKISKFEDKDIFTGKTTDLVEYKGKMISKSTIKELSRLILN